MGQEPSVAQKLIGDFTPKLVDLTDRVLFAMFGNARSFLSVTAVWQRCRR
jgi:hypothetical protein